ncbi:hypothetical protein ACOME3_007361 [Neoechinorhynchus agilis]
MHTKSLICLLVISFLASCCAMANEQTDFHDQIYTQYPEPQPTQENAFEAPYEHKQKLNMLFPNPINQGTFELARVPIILPPKVLPSQVIQLTGGIPQQRPILAYLNSISEVTKRTTTEDLTMELSTKDSDVHVNEPGKDIESTELGGERPAKICKKILDQLTELILFLKTNMDNEEEETTVITTEKEVKNDPKSEANAEE